MLKSGESRVSNVIDSIGYCLPYTNDHRIVSTPEKINGTQGADSPVSLGYGSVVSGKPKSSVSPDSNCNPSSPKKLLKMPQVDVTDACRMSQDNFMSSSEHYESVMPVEEYAEEYNMNHKRRGKAVIFNHDVFEDLPSRPGSAVDVSVLTETYGALGFEVVVHENLKFTDIQNAISELAEEDHSDADCLLVTVLTHGDTSKYLCAQDCLYNVEDLWLPFTTDKCLSLAGKPKIFIIEASRGDKLDPGVTLKQGTERRTESDSIHDGWGPGVMLRQGKERRMETDSIHDGWGPGVILGQGKARHTETDSIHDGWGPGVMLRRGKERHMETGSKKATYKIPTQADFLIAYSTSEGYNSWCNISTGTWFIQSLCKELQEHASTEDFLKILTQTSRQVAIDYESYNSVYPWLLQQKQVPSFNSMLIRDIYFRPK